MVLVSGGFPCYLGVGPLANSGILSTASMCHFSSLKPFKISQSCQHVCLKHAASAWWHSKMNMDDFKL